MAVQPKQNAGVEIKGAGDRRMMVSGIVVVSSLVLILLLCTAQWNSGLSRSVQMEFTGSVGLDSAVTAESKGVSKPKPVKVTRLIDAEVARESIVDPEYVPFLVVCGGGNGTIDELQVLLNSMLLLSSKNMHFTFLTDEEGSKVIQKLFGSLYNTRVSMKVDIAIMNTTWILDRMHGIHFAYKRHHSELWGASKIFVHEYFPHLDKAILLDTDMIFLQDPARLYDEFNSTKSDQWMYRMVKVQSSVACSCVVLINMKLAREKLAFPDTYSEILKISPCRLRESRYFCPQGDQNYYNGLIKFFPEYFLPLSKRWNVDLCDKYENYRENKPVGIFHRNCYKRRHDVASPYFDYYTSYRWDWHSDTGHSRVFISHTTPRLL